MFNIIRRLIGSGQMERELETTWLRRRIIRLRAAFRYSLEPRVETILREIITEMEERLDALEADLLARSRWLGPPNRASQPN